MATWIKGNRYLSQSEMENNALIIYGYLSTKGWSLNAIAGMLGNMQSESTINPAIWQSLIEGSGGGGGFGLVQWTPWTNFTNWADSNGYEWTDGNAQLKWIDEQTVSFGQWIATSTYNISFDEFKISTQTVSWLASAFLKNFERAGVEVEAQRQSQANAWYTFLVENGASVTYTPRLDSSGIEGNKWYYANNPFYQSGFGLPNCTCYAWGRWGELMDEAPNLCMRNAEYWYDYNVDNQIYEYGQTPKLGAIIVWSYDVEGSGGHVAVVEQINADGSIVTSNSAWGGTFFYTQTLYPSNNYEWRSDTNFKGFIYCPKIFGGGSLPSTQKKKKKTGFNFILFDRKRRRKQCLNRIF